MIYNIDNKLNSKKSNQVDFEYFLEMIHKYEKEDKISKIPLQSDWFGYVFKTDLTTPTGCVRIGEATRR